MGSTSRIRPSRSKITITVENVVELSKLVLVPMKCDTLVRASPKGGMASEMAVCGQKLICWRAFKRHQIKHCQSRKTKSGGVQYICQLSKCTARLHNSMTSLKWHIENSHMKNWPLPCPFTDCDLGFLDFGRPQANTSTRSQDLVVHLTEKHRDLIGRELDIHDKILLPRWEPSPPAHLQIPPPLPPSDNILFGGLFLGPVTVRSTARLTRVMSAANGTSLPSSHSPKTPKRRKLLKSDRSRDPSPDHHRFQYEFEDFPKMEYHPETHCITPPGVLDAPHFAVRNKDEGFPQRRELVRALPILSVPVIEQPPPPSSIFYPALRQQVLVEYALGVEAL
ncbi:hypothetical protein DFH07DRAFT_483637 [Mycena maculata]|uniref:C2H2-type domain-containing protein n=1 Tax=Mycena maculata TaxID=230809 RepID=A0AAD7NCJ0_9AGAR|nr:hypothetical protein DFH07DRAFT_483637 [Mycena maculata]